MASGFDLYVQAFVSVFVLVDPVSRSIFFKLLTENEPQNRRRYAFTVMAIVATVLGVSALAGKEILDLLGISLDAFRVAGGLVLAAMGFEMLLGGEPSRAQGGEESTEPPTAEDTIIVPYSVPFMCGPGAIATVIAIAGSTDGWSGPLAALVAVGITVAVIPITHILLIDRINLSARAVTLLTKFGGLLVASIGVQLVLGGAKDYFAS
jgi:multiple antibiotic resistance protein